MELSLKNKKSILSWLICVSYAGMFFPIHITNIPIIVLVVFCVIYNSGLLLKTLKESTFLKIILGMYLLQVVGLFYTSNLKTGLFIILEKKIYLLIIPALVLPLFQKFNDDDNFILKRIGFITIISSIILLCIGAYKKFVFGDSSAFFYGSNIFEGFTSIHYPYYSMYFACGSLLLIDCLFDSLIKNKIGVLIITIIFLYSLGILILVASKTGIIAFCLASIIFLYTKLSNKKVFAICFTLFVFSASILFYLNEATRSRFDGLGEHLSVLTKSDLREQITITDLNIRLIFWKISILHAWQDHFILTGVGTGDAQDYLDSLYTLPAYQLFGYVGWDSHNQWVFTQIQLGLIGVLLMALLYVTSFKTAIKRKDTKFLSFLIITFAFSLSECILERNKGLIFFSLFFTLLSVSYSKKVGKV